MKLTPKVLMVSIILLALLAAIAPAAAQEPVEATVVPDLLNMRETPSTAGEIVDSLPRGTLLEVSGRENNLNDSGSWVFVSPVGRSSSGWVLASFLLFPENYNIGVLPVVDSAGAGAATSAAATSEGGTSTTVVSVSGGIAAVTNEFANFRTGPELTFDIIEQLDPGTDLILTGRNANSVWLQAVANGEVGWIFFQLVEADGEIRDLPVATGLEITGDVVSATTTTTTTTTTEGEDGESAVVVSSGPRPTGPRTNAQVSGNTDGRLNPTEHLGYALVYCVDGNGFTNTANYRGGGIMVFLYINGSVPFFASEAEIEATPTNNTEASLVKSEGGYALYRFGSNEFFITGADDKGEGFTFRWTACNTGYRAG